jgi:hypothetical protein
VNYIAGLAGRDVSRKDFRNIILTGKKKAQSGDTEGFTLYGLRG